MYRFILMPWLSFLQVNFTPKIFLLAGLPQKFSQIVGYILYLTGFELFAEITILENI